jgi:hypothetical protein
MFGDMSMAGFSQSANMAPPNQPLLALWHRGLDQIDRSEMDSTER